jgi:hypothetical protein
MADGIKILRPSLDDLDRKTVLCGVEPSAGLLRPQRLAVHSLRQALEKLMVAKQGFAEIWAISGCPLTGACSAI